MTSSRLLEFWFSAAVRKHWFIQSDRLDDIIRTEFGALFDHAAAGALDDWLTSAKDALALTIALDQFPRNMFRGTARAFATDKMARDRAEQALAQGFDAQLSADERPFLYLPFMHSEDLADQKRSVVLYERLGDPRALYFAQDHHDIIARFGRFPHRNATLGRINSAEETAFLETHKGF